MTKTEDEIIKELKDLLLLYKDIFEFGTEGSIRKTMPKKDNYSDDSNAYIDLYFPKKIPLDTRGGYKLKNNQGYVSIKETYIYKNNIKLNGEAVAYVYRYISEEGTEYLCYDSKSDASFPYNFH